MALNPSELAVKIDYCALISWVSSQDNLCALQVESVLAFTAVTCSFPAHICIGFWTGFCPLDYCPLNSFLLQTTMPQAPVSGLIWSISVLCLINMFSWTGWTYCCEREAGFQQSASLHWRRAWLCQKYCNQPIKGNAYCCLCLPERAVCDTLDIHILLYINIYMHMCVCVCVYIYLLFEPYSMFQISSCLQTMKHSWC